MTTKEVVSWADTKRSTIVLAGIILAYCGYLLLTNTDAINKINVKQASVERDVTEIAGDIEDIEEDIRTSNKEAKASMAEIQNSINTLIQRPSAGT